MSTSSPHVSARCLRCGSGLVWRGRHLWHPATLARFDAIFRPRPGRLLSVSGTVAFARAQHRLHPVDDLYCLHAPLTVDRMTDVWAPVIREASTPPAQATPRPGWPPVRDFLEDVRRLSVVVLAGLMLTLLAAALMVAAIYMDGGAK